MTDNELLDRCIELFVESFKQDITRMPDGINQLRNAYTLYQEGQAIKFYCVTKPKAKQETKCDCGAAKAKTTHANYCSFWRL
jgi:hypothetical protein